MSIEELRRDYHSLLTKELIRIREAEGQMSPFPSFADSRSKTSRDIAVKVSSLMNQDPIFGTLVIPQTAGTTFENITLEYIRQCFNLFEHLFPAEWEFSTKRKITDFTQYQHLETIDKLTRKSGREERSELISLMGNDYIVSPDIVIGRRPYADAEINQHAEVLGNPINIASRTSTREINHEDGLKWILHASVSCKWTLRSDRGQNARTEALNLIRNRKGRLPHVVLVTAEPLPSRISSIALGVGDLDCSYHIALPELQQAVEEEGTKYQKSALDVLIKGDRIRDISDLPFDLLL